MRRFSFRLEKRYEMKKQMEINGEMFEIIRSKYTPELIDRHWKNYSGKTLDYYYQKPSKIKKAIYADWRDWSSDPCIWAFEVISGSCFTFSLGAILKNEHGNDIGYIKIIKSHNYLYL